MFLYLYFQINQSKFSGLIAPIKNTIDDDFVIPFSILIYRIMSSVTVTGKGGHTDICVEEMIGHLRYSLH